MVGDEALYVELRVTFKDLTKSNPLPGIEARFTAWCLASRSMTRHVNLAVMLLDLGGAGLPSVAIRFGSLPAVGWRGGGSGLDFWPVRGALSIIRARPHTTINLGGNCSRSKK